MTDLEKMAMQYGADRATWKAAIDGNAPSEVISAFYDHQEQSKQELPDTAIEYYKQRFDGGTA